MGKIPTIFSQAYNVTKLLKTIICNKSYETKKKQSACGVHNHSVTISEFFGFSQPCGWDNLLWYDTIALCTGFPTFREKLVVSYLTD